jgi:hypothetical protein
MDNLRNAMIIGYDIERLPKYIMDKVINEAVNVGWIEKKFYTKDNVRLFLNACYSISRLIKDDDLNAIISKMEGWLDAFRS